MKRSIALLLAIFLLSVSLSACNPFEKAPKVAICVSVNTSLDISYLQTQLTEMGCEVSVYDKSADQDTQTNQIKQLLGEDYSLIIVEPFSRTATEEIIDAENRKNTQMLFVNCYLGVLDAPAKISFLVCSPNELGALQAQSVASIPENGDLNGDGIVSYAILSGSTDSHVSQMQCESIIAGLSGQTHLTTIDCVDPEGAEELCNNLLATYGRDLELLICTDSKLTETAAAVITQAGRVPGSDLYMIGAGETPEVINLLENDALSATVAPTRTDGKNQIIEISAYMLNGDSYRSTYAFNYSIAH